MMLTQTNKQTRKHCAWQNTNIESKRLPKCQSASAIVYKCLCREVAVSVCVFLCLKKFRVFAISTSLHIKKTPAHKHTPSHSIGHNERKTSKITRCETRYLVCDRVSFHFTTLAMRRYSQSVSQSVLVSWKPPLGTELKHKSGWTRFNVSKSINWLLIVFCEKHTKPVRNHQWTCVYSFYGFIIKFNYKCKIKIVFQGSTYYFISFL